jgi:peptidyl-prolyl cis-trans isomerase D
MTVTEEEINKNYAQNEHLYKTAAQASIEYVELNLTDLMSGIQATEEELLSFYEAELGTFTVAGRRRASHILFEAPEGTPEDESEAQRAKAKKVLTKIQQGEDFATLAKEFSEDIGSAKTGGDLGIITQGMMGVVFETALSELQAGETTDVIQTPYGFQIIKLTELEAASVQSYIDVKAKVEGMLKVKIATDEFYQLSERFAQLSFENPNSLDSLVDELGLVVKRQNNITKGTVEGIATDDRIRHAVFSEDVIAGNNSDVIELKPEHAVVLRIKDYMSESTTPIEEVRGAVELTVLSDKAASLLSDKGDEMLLSVKSGETVKAISDANGVELIDVGPVTRNDKSAPEELLRDAFSMSHPVDDKPSYKKSILKDGGVAIIQLRKIVDGDLADITDGSRESFKKFLARLKGEVTLAASLANLSVETDVVFANKSE